MTLAKHLSYYIASKGGRAIHELILEVPAGFTREQIVTFINQKVISQKLCAFEDEMIYRYEGSAVWHPAKELLNEILSLNFMQ